MEGTGNEIVRDQEESFWAYRFDDDTHVSNQIVPGAERHRSHWMCGNEARGILRRLFGAPGAEVQGKTGQADFLLLSFRGNKIAAVSEPGIGTSWRIFSGEEGSRYGQYMLLPEDKDFWNDFCSELCSRKEALPSSAGTQEKMMRTPALQPGQEESPCLPVRSG